MRAKEFISEALLKAHDSFENACPGMVGVTNHNDKDYDHYKLGVFAGMSEEDLANTHSNHDLGNRSTFHAYTPHERDKWHRGMKKMGLNPTDLVSDGSHENDDIHRVSPVARHKPNKYGI